MDGPRNNDSERDNPYPKGQIFHVFSYKSMLPMCASIKMTFAVRYLIKNQKARENLLKNKRKIKYNVIER